MAVRLPFRRFLVLLFGCLASLVVLPLATMLAIFAVSVAYSYSFSTVAQVPFLVSVLYWFSKIGTVDSPSESMRTIEFSITPSLTESGDLTRPRSSGLGRLGDGLPVSAYSLYFFGLGVASFLIVFHVV